MKRSRPDIYSIARPSRAETPFGAVLRFPMVHYIAHTGIYPTYESHIWTCPIPEYQARTSDGIQFPQIFIQIRIEIIHMAIYRFNTKNGLFEIPHKLTRGQNPPHFHLQCNG
jgi:hypothetical protein